MRLQFTRKLFLIEPYSVPELLLIRADPGCGFRLIVSPVSAILIDSLFPATFPFSSYLCVASSTTGHLAMTQLHATLSFKSIGMQTAYVF
ncbi:MAG TPA: hypothetical protein VGM27_10265 [Acidobacteriaceae bacterium]